MLYVVEVSSSYINLIIYKSFVEPYKLKKIDLFYILDNKQLIKMDKKGKKVDEKTTKSSGELTRIASEHLLATGNATYSCVHHSCLHEM